MSKEQIRTNKNKLVEEKGMGGGVEEMLWHKTKNTAHYLIGKSPLKF